jgi:hypothetical protein
LACGFPSSTVFAAHALSGVSEILAEVAFEGLATGLAALLPTFLLRIR